MPASNLRSLLFASFQPSFFVIDYPAQNDLSGTVPGKPRSRPDAASAHFPKGGVACREATEYPVQASDKAVPTNDPS
jgi:hypothetical protein